MVRYKKFHVIKLDDAERYLDGMQRLQLEDILTTISRARHKDGKSYDKRYVCIGEDWPMYEDTWRAIEEWVDGMAKDYSTSLQPHKQQCEKCDGFGGTVTFANQASMPINGKVRCIDWCIHHIVAALNAGGVETVASCCGHGVQEGRIDLADGRVLTITARVEEE